MRSVNKMHNQGWFEDSRLDLDSSRDDLGLDSDSSILIFGDSWLDLDSDTEDLRLDSTRTSRTWLQHWTHRQRKRTHRTTPPRDADVTYGSGVQFNLFVCCFYLCLLTHYSRAFSVLQRQWREAARTHRTAGSGRKNERLCVLNPPPRPVICLNTQFVFHLTGLIIKKTTTKQTNK